MRVGKCASLGLCSVTHQVAIDFHRSNVFRLAPTSDIVAAKITPA